MTVLSRILVAFGHKLKALASDRSANFALISALAMVPLVGIAGLAVDYTNASRARTRLQQALDTASLAVARAGSDVSKAAARRIAEEFLSSNFGDGFKDLDVVRNGTSVTVSARIDVDLYFGGILGQELWPIAVASSADVAVVSYEIALVLDTTGSMRGGKLEAMKEAVLGLIQDISTQVTDKDRLKFSLVPFATFVNVGPQYGPEFDRKGRIKKGTGAPWLDLHGKSKIPQVELTAGISRFELFHNLKQEWKGCVETRMPSKHGAHDVDDTPAVASDKSSLFVPAFAIDEPSYLQGYWNDYILSPVDPLYSPLASKLRKYGVEDLASETLSPVINLQISEETGPNYGCTMQPVTPLSSDYRGLQEKVRALQASGNTNIMEGVAWGMRVLSPHEPFAGGDPRPGLEKIMIVLTDGANTFGNLNNPLGSSYSSFGYLVDGRLDGLTAASRSKTNQAMNARTLAACGNAKSRYGIDIYTIRLEEPDVATGTLLSDCASTPDQYFDTPSRRQLQDVFRKIGEKIIRLRISS